MFNATQSFRLFTSAIQFCAAIGKKSAGMTKVANPGGCGKKFPLLLMPEYFSLEAASHKYIGYCRIINSSVRPYIRPSVLIIRHSHTWSCLSKRLNLQGAPFSSLSVSSSSLRFGAAILLFRISPLSFSFSVFFFNFSVSFLYFFFLQRKPGNKTTTLITISGTHPRMK